ncbi:MAG: carbohydrate-binding family 9-like protein [Oscillospiraceae bacterium]|nr:carbohydrate-binding family 9-like protein [Oscillospiraceae bacterium]
MASFVPPTYPETYMISSYAPSNPIYIGHFRKEGCTGPDTFAQLTWIPDEGFRLVMWSYNPNPLARFTAPNDPVCKDSCMECFLDVFPSYMNKGYINIEMNANGACLCAFGPNRQNRQFVTDLGFPQPKVTVTHEIRDGGACWIARTMIPASLIEGLYGMSSTLISGHKMKANFYTCAEDVEQPYWGSWSPVDKLDFHMPHCFGDLQIE